MNYTQAQIDRANAVSLEDFLRTQGETLIKSGREYRWNDYYHAWEPPFSNLRATEICCIITLESHHYI